MSYRDYLKEQKKLIDTKKEARQAKEERLNNPRPQRVDPPPPKTNYRMVIIIGLVLFAMISWTFYAFTVPTAMVTDTNELTVWIQGNYDEFLQISTWLDKEIAANNLTWTIRHFEHRSHLITELRSGANPNLFLIEPSLALELYESGSLATLTERHEVITFESVFAPLWDEAPFAKTLGWAIPITENVQPARHLYTVIKQFSEPFVPTVL